MTVAAYPFDRHALQMKIGCVDCNVSAYVADPNDFMVGAYDIYSTGDPAQAAQWSTSTTAFIPGQAIAGQSYMLIIIPLPQPQQ